MACHLNSFLDVLIETPFKDYDVHILPQKQLLCIGNQLVPQFVGRVEQINEHWAELRNILSRSGIDVMEFYLRRMYAGVIAAAYRDTSITML